MLGRLRRLEWLSKFRRLGMRGSLRFLGFLKEPDSS
jgi:hypothetical protein